MSRIISRGRLLVIDPNQDAEGRGIVPYNLEDLCIGVALKVYCPNRSSANDLNKSNVINFIIGNGEYLTTDYTDINCAYPLSNTVEGMGIENIDISYSSWYYPEVTVKFVDVRGASLFMPEENQSNASFFNALFHFPSPTFELEIKGFLGGTATYELKVSDFRGELNSETGNFEATVTFIGSMYGAYADMPMSYLAVAPWMQGTYNGYNYWESANFRDYEGNKILKFSEFAGAVENAKKGGTNNNGMTQTNNVSVVAEENESIENSRRKLDLISEIKATALKMALYLAKDKNGEGHAKIYNENGNIYFYTMSGRKKVDVNKIIDEDKAFETLFKDFSSKVSEAKSLGISLPLLSKENIKNDLICIDSDIQGSTITTEWIAHTFNGDEQDKEAFFGNGGDSLIPSDVATNKKLKKKTFNFFKNFCSGLMELCKAAIETENANVINQNKSITKKRDLIISENLGFKHSISNVFRMGFAHFDTFAHLFDTCIKNIQAQLNKDDRGVEKFGWRKENTDVLELYNDGLPPFPVFYKTEIDEDGAESKLMVWPGSIKNGNTLEEVKFVESMYQAIWNHVANFDSFVNVPSSMDTSITGNLPDKFPLLPLLYADIPEIQGGINPYAFISNVDIPKNPDDGYKTVREHLFSLLWLRTSMCVKQKANIHLKYWSNAEATRIRLSQDAGLVGKIEAYNFFNANTDLPITFWTEAVGWTFEDFKNFLFNTENEQTIYTGVGGNIFGNKTTDTPDVLAKIINLEGGTHWMPSWTNNYLILAPTRIDRVVKLKEEPCKVVESSLSGMTCDEVKNCFTVYTNEYIDSLFIGASACVSATTRQYLSFFPVIMMQEEKKDGTHVVRNVIDPSQEGIGETEEWDTKKTSEGLKYERSILICDKGKDTKKEQKQEEKGKFTYTIFGCPYYYAYNNENFSGDRLLSKAYVYLHSLKLDEISYGQMLRLGSEVSRKEDNLPIIVDKEVYPQLATTIVDIDAFDNEAKKAYAKEVFKKWATNEFKKINDILEIQLENKEGEAESINEHRFKSYIESLCKKDKEKVEITWKAYFWKDKKNPVKHKVISRDKAIVQLVGNYPDGQGEVSNAVAQIFNYAPIIHPCAYFEKGNYVEKEEWYRSMFEGFVTELTTLVNGMEIPEDNNTNDVVNDVVSQINNNDDAKFAIYLGLKNLYENAFSGKDLKNWELNYKGNHFENFKFLDSFMRDIGHKWPVDVEGVANDIKNNTANSGGAPYSASTSLSFYSFLAGICEGANGTLLALPTFSSYFSSGDATKSLANNLFEPHMYRENTSDKSATYLCLYPGKPSEHLQTPSLPDNSGSFNNYRDDGFNLTDDDIPQFKTDGQIGENDNLVPCFVVDYGKQNQGIFKKITVGMQDPKQTETSINYTMDLASRAGQSAGEGALNSQNLYSIYSTNSYNCTVEMFGNIEIMPLMYFQLDHCPMFNGAYEIIEVKHNIEPGNMTTTFTGIRQSLSKVPFVDVSTIINNIDFPGRDGAYIVTDGGSEDGGGNYPADIYEGKSLGDIYPGETEDFSTNESTNWKEWIKGLKQWNNTNIEEFCFGKSVYNRMKFYYEHKITDGKKNRFGGLCGTAVHEFLECCTHYSLPGGFYGWNSYQVLEKLGFVRITENNIFKTPDGIELNLTEANNRQTFTNKWAKNGDICVLKESEECALGTKYSSGPNKGKKIGHVEMFINDRTLLGPTWVADAASNNMSCYGSCPIELIAVYRHPSIMTKTQMTMTNTIKEYLSGKDIDKYKLKEQYLPKGNDIIKKIMSLGVTDNRIVAAALASSIYEECSWNSKAYNEGEFTTSGWTECGEGLCQITWWSNKNKVLEKLHSEGKAVNVTLDKEQYKSNSANHISDLDESDAWWAWYYYLTLCSANSYEKLKNATTIEDMCAYAYLYKAAPYWYCSKDYSSANGDAFVAAQMASQKYGNDGFAKLIVKTQQLTNMS